MTNTIKPMGWARRWYVDGEVPKKEPNENGRLAWPTRFLLRPVTDHQCLPTDVPLYTVAQLAQMQQPTPTTSIVGSAHPKTKRRGVTKHGA